MKAISLWQPWASLIADGRKVWETRPRPLSHRGLLAIHAGLSVDMAACEKFGYNPETIECGAVLCIVNMVDCVQFPHPSCTADSYGNYADGRYGYALELIQRIEPVPARGYQMLWKWFPEFNSVASNMECNVRYGHKPLCLFGTKNSGMCDCGKGFK